MYTPHSYLPGDFERCAEVLTGVVTAIPQNPHEVMVRYRGSYFEPVILPFAELDQSTLGTSCFLSMAIWGWGEGEQTKWRWATIFGSPSHFRVFQDDPKKAVRGWGVGPLTDPRDDNPDGPYLQVTRPDDLERVVTGLLLQ